MADKDKYVPLGQQDNLAALAEMAYRDPDILAIRPLLATMAARFQQLLGRVSTAESQNRWKAALDSWRDFRGYLFREFGKNLAKLDASDELQEAFWKHYGIMDGAYHDYQSWREIHDASRLYVQLSESERKRLKDMQQMISSEEAMDLIADLQNVITEELVDDHPEILIRITNKFARRVGVKDDNWPRGGSDKDLNIRPGSLDGERILDTRSEGSDPVGWLSKGLLEGGAEEE